MHSVHIFVNINKNVSCRALRLIFELAVSNDVGGGAIIFFGMGGGSQKFFMKNRGSQKYPDIWVGKKFTEKFVL